MTFSFTDILLVLITFQFVIFVLYLIQKGKKKLPNIILIAFFLSEIFGFIPSFVFTHYDYFYNNCPYLFFIGIPAWYLLAPLMYIYVKSMVNSKFKLNAKLLLHLIPYTGALLYFLFGFHIHSTDFKKQLLEGNIILGDTAWLIIKTSFTTQVVVYNIFSLFLLYSYRRKLKNQLSSLKNKDLSWLRFFLFCFITACLSVHVFIPLLHSIVEFNVRLVNLLIFFVIFTMLFYKAIIKPDAFVGVDEEIQNKKKSLSKSSSEQYLEKLQTFMNKEKPYLDPDITLTILADKVAIPHRSLSEVLNDSLGCSFYNFINSYRIKESERLFQSPSTHDKTILEVLYAVGFNSKSSFNNAFKKETGMTPSQYRKQKECLL